MGRLLEETARLGNMFNLIKVYFGLPPALVLIGAIAMTASVIWLGFSFINLKLNNEK